MTAVPIVLIGPEIQRGRCSLNGAYALWYGVFVIVSPFFRTNLNNATINDQSSHPSQDHR
jgi:hypothetical protein